MEYNALDSADRVEPLFPEGHALRALVRPTFDTIRRSLAGCYISAIWVDSAQDPSREGFRPSYDSIYGPGSANVMPFIACWLSTGPGTEGRGNVAVLPEAIDRTIVEYARRIGIVGEVQFVRNIAHLKELVPGTGRKVYSIDDLGEDFEAHVVVGARLSRWLNSKEDLSSVSAYAPAEVVKDMFDVSLADYESARRGDGRVFLKTCNTESAGAGVFIANSAAEFEKHLDAIRARQQKYGLNRRLVVQPEIKGRNRSFQVFLDPTRPAEIQVVAVTDQLVEADGKTYRASVNYPITAANVERVGPAILDMAARVRARHPEAFGFLMCDYFDTEQGVVIYDPGIRPTGNTATAMVFHLARKLTGRDPFVSMLHLRTGVAGLKFAQFAERAGRLVDPENLRTDGRAVLPWGWNDIQGFGVLLCVAGSEAEADALKAEVAALRY